MISCCTQIGCVVSISPLITLDQLVRAHHPFRDSEVGLPAVADAGAAGRVTVHAMENPHHGPASDGARIRAGFRLTR